MRREFDEARHTGIIFSRPRPIAGTARRHKKSIDMRAGTMSAVARLFISRHYFRIFPSFSRRLLYRAYDDFIALHAIRF